MPRIAPRIPRADVVGSLLRPRRLLDARHAWREGRLTEAQLEGEPLLLERDERGEDIGAGERLVAVQDEWLGHGVFYG